MAEFLKVAKADELSPGQARRVKVLGKRPSRAPKHRPLQRSADGDRYPDSGLAKAIECDQAEG
jgi:hypothetical protein